MTYLFLSSITVTVTDEMTQLAVSNASRSQSAQNKAFSRYTSNGSTGSGTAALPHQYQTSNRSGMCVSIDVIRAKS